MITIHISTGAMRPESLDEIVTHFATTKCLEERLTVAKRLLNYRPIYNLEKGIKKYLNFINFINKNKNN